MYRSQQPQIMQLGSFAPTALRNIFLNSQSGLSEQMPGQGSQIVDSTADQPATRNFTIEQRAEDSDLPNSDFSGSDQKTFGRRARDMRASQDNSQSQQNVQYNTWYTVQVKCPFQIIDRKKTYTFTEQNMICTKHHQARIEALCITPDDIIIRSSRGVQAFRHSESV